MLWTKGRETSEDKASGKWLRLIYQLGFYLFETLGMLFIFFEFPLAPANVCLVLFNGLTLAVFLLTFGTVYKVSEERFLRTVFIQGGGVFTVLYILFVIFMEACYLIYKAVKESYVIPNFTEQQICDARKLYYQVCDVLGFMLISYIMFTVLPLIIASIISYVRKKCSRKKELSESLPNGDTDGEILQ